MGNIIRDTPAWASIENSIHDAKVAATVLSDLISETADASGITPRQAEQLHWLAGQVRTLTAKTAADFEAVHGAVVKAESALSSLEGRH